MRHMLLIILLLSFCAPLALAENIPEPNYASLLSALDEWDLVDVWGGVEESGHQFLLLQQGEWYRICILAYGQSGWRIDTVSSLLPKRGDVVPTLHLAPWSSTPEAILYIPVFYLVYYDTAPRSPDTVISHVTYTFKQAPDKSWQLVDFATEYHIGNEVHYGGGAFLYPYEIRLSGIFEPGGPHEEHRIFGTLDRDLRTISLDRIPLTPADGAQMVDTKNLAMVSNPNPQDRLHLRAEPSKDSDSKGAYYNGCPVTVLSYANAEWAKVAILGVEGYMMRQFLALSGQYGEVKPVLTTRTHHQDGDLPLYQSPDSQSPVVTTIQPSTDVYQWGITEDGWSHVLYKNVGGYIQSECLTEGNG